MSDGNITTLIFCLTAVVMTLIITVTMFVHYNVDNIKSELAKRRELIRELARSE